MGMSFASYCVEPVLFTATILVIVDIVNCVRSRKRLSPEGMRVLI